MTRKILRLGAAVAVVALSALGALALDINQNQIVPARQNSTQQTSYYRVTVNFSDPRISTGQVFGKLLQNSFISNVACHVTTVFNAGSTNVFTLGTSLANANEIIDAATANGSINEASATYQQITLASRLGVSVTSGGDVNLFAKYTQTGTPATTGQVMCVIEFIPNNDN